VDLSNAWSGKECGQERCEVGVGEPDWMRWAGSGGCGWAYDLELIQEGRFEELDTCE